MSPSRATPISRRIGDTFDRSSSGSAWRRPTTTSSVDPVEILVRAAETAVLTGEYPAAIELGPACHRTGRSGQPTRGGRPDSSSASAGISGRRATGLPRRPPWRRRAGSSRANRRRRPGRGSSRTMPGSSCSSGRFAESMPIAEEALDIARTIGSPSNQAMALGIIGTDLALLGAGRRGPRPLPRGSGDRRGARRRGRDRARADEPRDPARSRRADRRGARGRGGGLGARAGHRRRTDLRRAAAGRRGQGRHRARALGRGGDVPRPRPGTRPGRDARDPVADPARAARHDARRPRVEPPRSWPRPAQPTRPAVAQRTGPPSSRHSPIWPPSRGDVARQGSRRGGSADGHRRAARSRAGAAGGSGAPGRSRRRRPVARRARRGGARRCPAPSGRDLGPRRADRGRPWRPRRRRDRDAGRAITGSSRSASSAVRRRPGSRRPTTPPNGPRVADAFEAIGRPYPAAYARYRVGAAILRDRGPRDDAEAALSAALATAQRLGARPLADEIGTLARHARLDLAGTEVAPTADPATDPATRLGLTEREAEVLGFIAAGWSNQEIADALFISRKTVSVHASNIFDKLGAGNRSRRPRSPTVLVSTGTPRRHRVRMPGRAPSSRPSVPGPLPLELVEPRVGDPEMVGDLVIDGVGHGGHEALLRPVRADERAPEDRDLAGDRCALCGPARPRDALVEPVQAVGTDRARAAPATPRPR